MSRGTEFLTAVTEKLKREIQKIERCILQGEKDVDRMNEYYWENYTEMDQYGYENFDNQQALFQQENVNEEKRKQRHTMKKMLDAPFFGSIDFLYEGEEEAESFYIGIGNFSEETGGVPLIYDWRAPVSGLFYDYVKGEASYEAPGGMMKGEILSKWQYKIRHGEMVYEFESDLKIDDDILKQELGENGDVQLKNIVRTIQKEQNVIIRNTSDRILAIQGAAGSGKTSVALHRIAYLLYHDRGKLKSSDILVLSPNSVFSDYISHILPELGEENIREMSLDLFAYKELQETAADCEDRYDYIEERMASCDEEAKTRYQWKQSEKFVREAEGFFLNLEEKLVDFKDLEYKKVEMKAEEILNLFYYKFPDIPLLSRMEAIAEYFIDSVETLIGYDLSEEERSFLNHKFTGMYVTRDLYEIYGWFLEEQGLPMLKDCAREDRILHYEDVYPLLYLKCRLFERKEKRIIKHLVVDEMQDYTFLQYTILEKLFDCPMTILGDQAQTMEEKLSDVTEFLPRIFGKHIRKIIMNKSYRNTLEIAAYAAELGSAQEIEFLERHGKAVTEQDVSNMEEAAEKIKENLHLGEREYETAAVLTMTEGEARKIWEVLKDRNVPVSYIDRDSKVFRKGLTVTPFYLAKGLEFDQVFIIGGQKEHPMFAQYRYISATRALHELYVYDLKTFAI